jgi:hypothetical protein
MITPVLGPPALELNRDDIGEPLSFPHDGDTLLVDWTAHVLEDSEDVN